MAVGWWQGWTPGAGLVFGIALSVASTVVLLRLLQERRLLDTERGRITVGWLIVQDLGMVLVLVLLPALAGVLKGTGDAPDAAQLLQAIALTLGKVAAFIVIMLVVGRKVIPLILHYVAHTGSRELFRLAVLSIALGFAYLASELFGVSLALGAFFAGMILSESRLSQQAATEVAALARRLRRAVLRLGRHAVRPEDHRRGAGRAVRHDLHHPRRQDGGGLPRGRLFGHQIRRRSLSRSASRRSASSPSSLPGSASASRSCRPKRATSSSPAPSSRSSSIRCSWSCSTACRCGAIAQADGVEVGPPPEARGREPIPVTRLTDHVVLVGHGRVGSVVSEALRESGIPFLVIESDQDAAAELRQQSIETITGNAADPEVVRATNLASACCLLVAIPEAFEGGQVVMQARAANPDLLIIARAHSEEEVAHLKKHGASTVIMGELEIARAMIEDVRKAVTVPRPVPEEARQSYAGGSGRRGDDRLRRP